MAALANWGPGALFFATIINLDLLAFGPTGYGDELFWGLLLTVQISVLSYAFGLFLGLCGAMGKLAGGKWLQVYWKVTRHW